MVSPRRRGGKDLEAHQKVINLIREGEIAEQ
jgi:hypothetical protein